LAPEDKNGIVWMIFFLWGIGTLLPWNAICNEFDFFEFNMKDMEPGSRYPSAVNGMLSITQILMIFFGNKLRDRTKI